MIMDHEIPADNEDANRRSDGDSAGSPGEPVPPVVQYQGSLEMALTSALCLVVACGATYGVVKTDWPSSVKIFAGVTGLCFFIAGIIEAARVLHHSDPPPTKKN